MIRMLLILGIGGCALGTMAACEDLITYDDLGLTHHARSKASS